MPVLSTRTQVLIGIALALLLAITRGNHFATLNLPSASWAVFFLAGVLLRPRWVFAGLFALASALDFSMLASGTVSDWCLSPAYWMLVPAYATLWLAGRLYAGWHRDTLQSLLLLAAVVAVSAFLCNLLSGGGFYFFMQAWKRNERVQRVMDRLLLRLPIFGSLIDKSCVARWTRTLATMFANVARPSATTMAAVDNPPALCNRASEIKIASTSARPETADST